ncbi:MAG: MFS transporter, partial [Gemmatimonadales bacterium]
MKRISVLMATVFVDMLGFAIVFPLIPLYADRFGADPWLIGWLVATFNISQFASAPLWGRFSDRYGRRPAIIVGLTASALAFIVFGLATSLWMLFASRLVQGIGGGTTGVAQAYVGDAITPKDRAKALGWLSAATSTGVMFGPVIGSLSFNLGPAAPGLQARPADLHARA